MAQGRQKSQQRIYPHIRYRPVHCIMCEVCESESESIRCGTFVGDLGGNIYFEIFNVYAAVNSACKRTICIQTDLFYDLVE